VNKAMTCLIVLLGFGQVNAADQLRLDLTNERLPQQNRLVSGAIDAEDLGRLRAAGVRHVINLRTQEESKGFAEAQIAAGLGIDYHSIPIKGAESLTKENARMLDELLEQAGEEPTLIHCASGNRVGALIAVREAWIKGQSVEAAIAEGKRWGLTGLEGAVRGVLESRATTQ
jgi:uncharacterized protein (TIGR01244 family)